MSLNKLGRYDLIRVLGKGAMGLVYEGRDPNLDRRVAIKTIKVENLSDEAAAEYEVRFRTEARSAARLQHPNIVSVYDSDRDLDIAYLVMEFVQGDDLKHHLDKGEVYTLEQTLGIMGDLLSALDYAHRQHIVHRDIKPANLLIEANGRVKLTDFGVARIQDSGEATRTQGSMVGTLKYMSPEQVQGRPVDARADLFAAGIVLHQLLTGKRPFDGDSDFAVIQQIVGHQPAAPTYFNPHLPPAIDAVVARALAKSRDERFPTAQMFLEALQAASQQAVDQTVVPPSSPPSRGASATWTGTLRAGESLVNTRSGTLAGTNLGTNTGSGTSPSTVTQELELVYWKDIKDSGDAHDIELFLTKFPSGVYADLARRKLRNRASLSGDASDTGLQTQTLVAPVAPVAAAGVVDPDKTIMLPRQAATTATTAPADPAIQAALAGPSPEAQPSAGPPADVSPVSVPGTATATPSRRGVWLLAAVSVVAVVGLGLKVFSGADAPATTSPQVVGNLAELPSVAASANAAAAPPTALQTALPAVAALAAMPASAASTASAALTAASAARMATGPASAPASAASRAALLAATARRQAQEKDKLAKQALEKSTAAAMPASPAAAAPPAAAPERAVAAAAPVAAATNPRQACEDRVLLGFQICMREQCAKPAFAAHPICVERKALEQKRQEAEQTRR